MNYRQIATELRGNIYALEKQLNHIHNQGNHDELLKHTNELRAINTKVQNLIGKATSTVIKN